MIEREAFYNVLFSRRDVRGEFMADPIADATLARILYAAHHAPSVGLSQPWNFVLVRNPGTKQRVHDAFRQAHEQEALQFEGQRQRDYRKLRLEGILQAPINLLVTCDRNRGGPAVLGRTRQPQTDLYSTVCAIQNLWLAARAEDLGMGWVSILDLDALRSIFKLPDHVEPMAYLCLGRVEYFFNEPELQARQWAKRLPLEELVFEDRWGYRENNGELARTLAEHRTFPLDRGPASSE